MPPGRPPKTPDDKDEFAPLASEIAKVNRQFKPKSKPEKKTVTFMLVGDFKKDEQGNVKYPPAYIINNEYPVYDEDRKEERTARVLNGISTIWRDEQEKVDPNYAKNNKVLFHFTNGKLVIPTLYAHHIKYLRLRADFAGCKNPLKNVKIRYKEVDTEANELKAYELMERRHDAVRKALDADYEDAIAHFKHLGGNIMNDEGNELTEEGFRSAYVKLAEEKTELFLKSYDNPVVKMFGLVRLGFEQNKIVFVDGQVSWADTNTFICQVPADRQGQVSDYLAQLMLTPEGLELRGRLQQLK